MHAVSFLGMSYLEILVVALVAFVFLGPERMVDMARKLGKMVSTVRAMAADLPSIEELDLDGTRGRAGTRPAPTTDGGPRRSDEELDLDGTRGRAGTRPAPTTDGGPRRSDEELEEDRPVAFRASPPPPPAPVKKDEGAGLDSGLRRNDEEASGNRS